MEKTLNVQGMSCGHCKASVEGALQKLDGVSAADVNLEAGTVVVSYDEVNVTIDTMVEAIEDQGYDVTV
ncbi:copper chaperone CopZ [Terribacillus halophilus]|uniref:copper chaperone CopZ n=1 Tax=Terribacillus halophilus TaxID=361279 RepID=UPI000986EF32|nr:copper chaperone CopZ [Terribacillus halophilus]